MLTSVVWCCRDEVLLGEVGVLSCCQGAKHYRIERTTFSHPDFYAAIDDVREGEREGVSVVLRCVWWLLS